MNTYSKPISLILIGGCSDLENQTLHATLQADEYVFASATDLYNLLDIAECHQPKAVLIDFVWIEHNYLAIIQFLQFLHIPAIVLSDDLGKNMIQYLSLAGVFATLKKTNNELELRHTLAMAAYPESLNPGDNYSQTSSFDLANLQKNKQNKLQDVVNKAIGTAVSQISEMIGCEIEHDPPSSQALSPLVLQKTLVQTLGKDLVAVAQLDFSGNLSGSAQMLFSQEAADAIVLTLNGGGDVESDEFKQDKADIMGEIGNLAISGIVGTFSNTLKYNLGYVVPHYVEGSAEEIFGGMNFSARSTIILFMSHFKIIDFHVEGDFILFFQARLLLDLLFHV
jgi:chemotaxis protein CheY-P-specific phosphatase CheC